MVDRAAAGHAAHHGQAAPADEVAVNLVQRHLMASHDDAGGILPEQKQARMIRRQPLQQAFFKSEIESRIRGGKGKKLHETLLKKDRSRCRVRHESNIAMGAQQEIFQKILCEIWREVEPMPG